MRHKFSKQGMLFGTLLLLCTNIYVKGLGFLYRVLLVRQIGTEGIGLIEMAGPVFSFLLVLAGCGMQTALSQTIPGKPGERKKEYFCAAIRFLFINGFLVTVLGYLLLPLILRFAVTDQRVELCLKVLLPAVAVISTASAWRGWYQGTRQVAVLGLSQSAEQTVRTLTGLFLTQKTLLLGTAVTAGAASAATVLGETAGLLLLLFWMRVKESRILPDIGNFASGRHIRELFTFGLPLTAGRLLSTLISMLQAFLIPLGLQTNGLTPAESTAAYGQITGVALSLLHLPGVFSSALSVSVLPAVAESVVGQQNSLCRRVETALRATILFTLPSMLILYRFREPLCTLLFHDSSSAPILQILAPGGIFLYLQITLTSILQGLGRVRQLLLNTVLSGVLMLTGFYFMVPRFGIYGAAAAIDLAWFSGFLVNLAVSGLAIRWQTLLLRPAFAMALTLLVVSLFHPQLAALPPTHALLIEMGMLMTLFCGILLLGGYLPVGRNSSTVILKNAAATHPKQHNPSNHHKAA